MASTITRRSIPCAALFVCVYALVVTQPWTLLAQSNRRNATQKPSPISESDLREWLGYLASDELQGRQVFTEGYGLAAQYVASHLKEWGVAPLGAGGTYLQAVKLRGYRVTRNSSVTVESKGESKTFKHGDHVTFVANAGGKQTLTFTGVEFLGYGQPADLQGRDLKGKLVVIYFGYTFCPDACPMTLAKLAQARAQLGAKLRQRRRLIGGALPPALGEHHVQLALAPLQANRTPEQPLELAQRPAALGAGRGAPVFQRRLA